MTSQERNVDLVDALGGPRGLADSGLPGVVFVAAYTISGQDLEVSIWSALAVALVLTGVRLALGETLQFAIAGLFGVGIAAFVTSRTGKAEDFFLPGLLFNAGYAAAYLISIVVRWPLIGVIVGPLTGEGMEWRRDRAKVRTFSLASWIWVGVFTVRLAVQLPLYLAEELVALGVAKALMGVPIFALALWLTYLVLRQGGVVSPSGPDTSAR